MRQSIPAVPITPGISRAFADILISGVGHLKNFHCPGVGHLPTHRAALGHLTPMSGFGHARNKWILKVIQNDHFRKNLSRFRRFVK